MSYSTREAEVELTSVIDETLQTRDVEKAYAVARTLAEMEDYEEASHFRKLARQWEREDDMPNV